MLELEGIARSFGELKAVNGVSIQIQKGTITGLIGPNGAGKTTLFNIIAGALKPDSGQIRLDGEAITRIRGDQIYSKGMGRTFQIPKIFASMSVIENVMTAPTGQIGERFWANWINRASVKRQEQELEAKARDIINFCNLGRVAGDLASSLSGGQMKLLELARVLMGDPKLILLDEPAAGVNPALLQILMGKIAEINQRGITFLIIEHNMDLIARLCDPVIAMAQGQVIFQGTAQAARSDQTLLDVYLGELVT